MRQIGEKAVRTRVYHTETYFFRPIGPSYPSFWLYWAWIRLNLPICRTMGQIVWWLIYSAVNFPKIRLIVVILL